MTDEETRKTEALESFQRVVDEITLGELLIHFSIGYSWEDQPESHDHLIIRQAALQAVTGILTEHMDEIMGAAKDIADQKINEWIDSDHEEVIQRATAILDEVDKIIFNAQKGANDGENYH